MFHQTIVGKPKHCLNRNCKTPFTRQSHLGWMPNNELEVYSIMRCPKCKDTFAVRQTYSMVLDYKNSLPKDTSSVPNSPITKSEMMNFRKKLESKDSLSNLYEGLKPNGSIFSEDESDK